MHHQMTLNHQTTLVVFQTPYNLWCFSCDSGGKILEAFPATVHRYIGSNIEDVQLTASSVLRYYVKSINDNEYPTKFEIIHNLSGVEVSQNGLKMEYVKDEGGDLNR